MSSFFHGRVGSNYLVFNDQKSKSRTHPFPCLKNKTFFVRDNEHTVKCIKSSNLNCTPRCIFIHVCTHISIIQIKTQCFCPLAPTKRFPHDPSQSVANFQEYPLLLSISFACFELHVHGIIRYVLFLCLGVFIRHCLQDSPMSLRIPRSHYLSLLHNIPLYEYITVDFLFLLSMSTCVVSSFWLLQIVPL